MTIETAYKEAKAEAMRDIGRAVVEHNDMHAIEEIANHAADEMLTDSLAEYGDREIADAAQRDSFVPGNWINLTSEASSIIWSLSHSAVNYDLRKSMRNRKAVLYRAQCVRTALDRLVQSDSDGLRANEQLTPLEAAGEFRSFTEMETDYPDTVLQEFHAGHAVGQVQFPVFGNPLADGEASIAKVVEALETWLVTEYPEHCPADLADNIEPIEA